MHTEPRKELTEQRKELRSIFTLQPKGKLQILLGEQCLDVSEVKDVSPMGIRLEVGSMVDVGENIQVRYRAEVIDLSLNGTVVWNSGSDDGGDEIEELNSNIIGIQLATPSLLHAFW